MSQVDQAAKDAGYVEYPILMAHPAFQKSEPVPIPGTEVVNAAGVMIKPPAYRGTPERMPPVTAMNEDDEEYYRSQGYERAGKMDPAAWVKAHSSSPVEAYKPELYPMWKNGVLIQRAEDDPEYDPEAAEVAEEKEPAEVVHQPNEAENLRAQMDSMQETMRQMMAQMQATQAENAQLKAKESAAQGPAQAAASQAFQAASSVAANPRQKRPYNKRQKAN
jgi:hypothetical protein